MKGRRKRYNTKRRIARDVSFELRGELCDKVRYGGNPEHKRNPGDFGLTPPSAPRPDSSLCDHVGVFTRAEALEFLRQGIRMGLVSERTVNGLPQNIWGMTEDGTPLEAQLENRELATYHGYPLTGADPFRAVVASAWNSAEKASFDE